MNGDQKAAVLIVLAFCVALSVIAWSVAWALTERFRAATEAGLVQRTLPGERGAHWVRPEEATDR